MKTERQIIPNWKEVVRYSPDGPQHVVLINSDSYRAVLVGLEAGVRIPPHPSSDATYHFLEGSGWMLLDDERQRIDAGSTIVVPAGTERGMIAETRLTFLGSHAGHKRQTANISSPSHHEKTNARNPLVLFGLMTVFMLVLMLGLVQIGASPMATMLANFGGLGAGVWGMMLVPMLGLLGMGVMMFYMYRTMGNAMNPAKHAAMMTERQAPHKQEVDPSLETATYTIPSINCTGCKKTIEERLIELEGVDSVQVDVATRQTVVRYSAPATKDAIGMQLEKIGYPATAG